MKIEISENTNKEIIEKVIKQLKKVKGTVKYRPDWRATEYGLFHGSIFISKEMNNLSYITESVKFIEPTAIEIFELVRKENNLQEIRENEEKIKELKLDLKRREDHIKNIKTKSLE